MPPVPRLTFRQIERILLDNDFVLKRTKGSHHRYVHQDGRTTVVANHGKKIIPLGTMRSIVKQAQLPEDAWSSN